MCVVSMCVFLIYYVACINKRTPSEFPTTDVIGCRLRTAIGPLDSFFSSVYVFQIILLLINGMPSEFPTSDYVGCRLWAATGPLHFMGGGFCGSI